MKTVTYAQVSAEKLAQVLKSNMPIEGLAIYKIFQQVHKTTTKTHPCNINGGGVM